MKRTRFARRGGAGRDADQLIRLAVNLAASGSRTEDAFWEGRLAAQVERLLRVGNEEGFNFALDHLYGTNLRAYDELADMIESRAESSVLTLDGQEYDVLLFAAPLLAWSRYTIPSGTLSQTVLASLRVQLQAHVFAADAKIALADFLFSPDQLPHGYAETYRLAGRLWSAALTGSDVRLDPRRMQETNRFISDSRYLVGAVATPRGAPLFRWQEDDGGREQADARWRAQGTPCLQSVFAGCAYEGLLPDAYHAACRNADRSLRLYSLHAAVAFLQTTLNLAPPELQAVVAPFHDQYLEEYRVGFTKVGAGDVFHGVVCPLLGSEDENSDLPAQIESALRDAGVGEVRLLEHPFPLEYCDDCGAPLYPNPEGETVHAELPEHAESAPTHLH
ncbi:MAG: DUF2863 family protein [Pseudomonadota bacterium]|jgi:hypothetical protein